MSDGERKTWEIVTSASAQGTIIISKAFQGKSGFLF